MTAHPTPDDETTPLLGHQGAEPLANENAKKASLVWTLAALWSAVFLGALDGMLPHRLVTTQLDTSTFLSPTGTIVATLLSPIGAYYNRSNQSSYIGTAYLLSVCCFTPLYGRLSDILGRKGAMLLALSLFGSGTLLCGIAPSMDILIAARAIAGMGGGGSVPKFHVIGYWL